MNWLIYTGIDYVQVAVGNGWWSCWGMKDLIENSVIPSCGVVTLHVTMAWKNAEYHWTWLGWRCLSLHASSPVSDWLLQCHVYGCDVYWNVRASSRRKSAFPSFNTTEEDEYIRPDKWYADLSVIHAVVIFMHGSLALLRYLSQKLSAITANICVNIIMHSLLSSTFSALTLLVGRQEGHLACKNWVVGWWGGYLSGWGADLHMSQLMLLPLTVSCFSKIQIGSGTGWPRQSWTKSREP